MNGIRRLVSQSKVRYVDTDNENDLDLAYITQRIIAMGFPSSGLSSAYRNPQKQVSDFFETNHPGHYKIFNLAEEPYDQTKFSGPIEHFPFPDHHSPPIPIYLTIIKHAIEWLDASPENVVAIHCIAGMGRTGTIIAGILQFMGLDPSADEALAHFALVRTGTEKGVSNPCQIRYVHYAEWILRKNLSLGIDKYTVPETPTRFLNRITLYNMFYKTTPSIYLTIQNNEWDVIYNSAWLEEPKDNPGINPTFPVNMNITGDFTINVYRINKSLLAKSTKKILYFTMSTAFIEGIAVVASKSQIDSVYKDTKNEKYPADCQLQLFFDPYGDIKGPDCVYNLPY